MLTSPRLAEVSARADQLLLLTAMGEQALEYLANGKEAPAGWKAKQMQALEEAKKPSALVRFTLLPSLEDVIKAVPGGE